MRFQSLSQPASQLLSFLFEPLQVGNVHCMKLFKSAKHLFRSRRVVVAPFQRLDDLAPLPEVLCAQRDSGAGFS